MAAFTGVITGATTALQDANILSGSSLNVDITSGGTERVKIIGISGGVPGSPGGVSSAEHLRDLLKDDDGDYVGITLTQDVVLTVPGSAPQQILYWVTITSDSTDMSLTMATDGYAKFSGKTIHDTTGTTVSDEFGNFNGTSAVRDAAVAAELASTGLWGTHWLNTFKATAGTPADSAVDVPIDQTISITFSHNIDNDTLYGADATYTAAENKASLTSDVVFLYNANMEEVACDVDSSGNVITIDPTVAMSTNTTYAASVKGIDIYLFRHPKNTAGTVLESTVNYFFTTGQNVSLDVTADQAASVIAGATVYNPVPVVQRPLEVLSISPIIDQMSNLSAMPTVTIQFTEDLIDTGSANDWDQAGTVVTTQSAGVFGSALTAVTTTPTISGGNLVFTPSGTIANNTRYVVTVSANITSTNGIQMQEDYKFTYTGTYSPLWVEAERVRVGLGEFGPELEDDFIHRIIYKNCTEINNRMTVASALWYHDELATLRTQHELLQILIMLKDAGVSTTIGVSFTQRVDVRMGDGLDVRLKQVEREIHALVNTEIYDDDATLARSMILASNLTDNGKLDQISMNRFYPRPNADVAQIGRFMAGARRGDRTGFGGTSTRRAWTVSENPDFANSIVNSITTRTYW